LNDLDREPLHEARLPKHRASFVKRRDAPPEAHVGHERLREVLGGVRCGVWADALVVRLRAIVVVTGAEGLAKRRAPSHELRMLNGEGVPELMAKDVAQ